MPFIVCMDSETLLQWNELSSLLFFSENELSINTMCSCLRSSRKSYTFFIFSSSFFGHFKSLQQNSVSKTMNKSWTLGRWQATENPLWQNELKRDHTGYQTNLDHLGGLAQLKGVFLSFIINHLAVISLYPHTLVVNVYTAISVEDIEIVS